MRDFDVFDAPAEADTATHSGCRISYSRRRPAVLLLAAIAIGVVAPLWSQAESVQAEPMIVKLSQDQNGTTVRLEPDSRVVVRLPVQLGTGYSWAVAKQGGKTMRLVKEEVERSPDVRPGGTEMQAFEFAPDGAGTVDVELAYRRPWLSDQPPAKTFRFHAVISQASPRPQ